MKTDRPLSTRQIFQIPALLALVSLAGLISALLGELEMVDMDLAEVHSRMDF